MNSVHAKRNAVYAHKFFSQIVIYWCANPNTSGAINKKIHANRSFKLYLLFVSRCYGVKIRSSQTCFCGVDTLVCDHRCMFKERLYRHRLMRGMGDIGYTHEVHHTHSRDIEDLKLLNSARQVAINVLEQHHDVYHIVSDNYLEDGIQLVVQMEVGRSPKSACEEVAKNISSIMDIGWRRQGRQYVIDLRRNGERFAELRSASYSIWWNIIPITLCLATIILII